MAADTSAKNSWIQQTPSVCGGRACIRNTCITVWGLVLNRRLGVPDEQLLQNIIGLTADDLLAAWDYYENHRAAIDEDIRENEED